MSKCISIEDFRKEEKRREIKEKINLKIKQGLEWVNDNKEALVVIVPVAIKGATTIFKVIHKYGNLRKEEQLKDLYCYDRSLGHYWKLRRELTNREWLEIDRRKQNGERLSDILDEMRVLK